MKKLNEMHIAFLVALAALVFSTALMAQTDSSVKCQSPDGEIRWFGNYTCPPMWTEIG